MPVDRLPAQITLIYGNQEHAIEQSVTRLIDSVLETDERSFSLYRFAADEIIKGGTSDSLRGIDDFRVACETVPLLGERVVVTLSHVELVKGAPPKKSGKEQETGDGGNLAARLGGVLTRIINQPPAGCWLILTAAAKAERELSKPLVKAVKTQGRLEKFVTYDDQEPVDWVLSDAKSLGLSLQRPHALMLISAVGNDMGRLHRELEKFSLLFEGDQPPDETQWRDVIHGEQHASLFFITDKLSSHDLSGALAVLEPFLHTSAHEFPMLVGILARHFRQLYRLLEMERQGIPSADHATRLKVHPFILRKLAAQAREFTTAELERILVALADIDLGFRRHPQLTAPVLRDFVEGICSGRYRTGTI